MTMDLRDVRYSQHCGRLAKTLCPRRKYVRVGLYRPNTGGGVQDSRHLDKFEDWMCKDQKTGEYIRADHLVENVLEARLRGDKEARVLPVDEKDAGDKSDFRNRKGKDATQLSSMMKSSGSMRRFLKRYLSALRIKSTIHSSSF